MNKLWIGVGATLLAGVLLFARRDDERAPVVLTRAMPRFSGMTPEGAALLVEMAERNGWDPEAIGAVIENESGWQPDAGLRVWKPTRTATGFLQFIESTAKAIAQHLGVEPGVQWYSRDWIGKLSVSEQMPLVEQFYRMTLGSRQNLRPVDYYLAPWGRGVGKPFDYVLATKGSPEAYQPGRTSGDVYEENAGLDANGNGRIEVSDLAAYVQRRIANAKARGTMGPGAVEPVVPGVTLPSRTLRIGAQGADVKLWQAYLAARGYDVGPVDGVFGAKTQAATEEFQRAIGASADGVAGPATYAAATTGREGEGIA